jgi:hypothetical protein
MGLFGGGNSQSTSNTTNFGATIAPGLSLSSSPNSAPLLVTPTVQGSGSIGSINAVSGSYYAPVNINASSNYGDAAVQASAQQQQAAIGGSSLSSTGAISSTLSSLLSGTNLYWILGALVLLFLMKGKT